MDSAQVFLPCITERLPYDYDDVSKEALAVKIMAISALESAGYIGTPSPREESLHPHVPAELILLCYCAMYCRWGRLLL